ncbi:ABC transporter ATP-binding protein [Nonomuraea sp. KC401]|uniref:ABC transporter ATP-binding protein n=1 Tax=unclassified Nonomuraea TaxID=2593643 RepID=UPI0010FF3410|nr:MULTISPECIES: ABC transporter ATP-binding protein [unclassified Nonomuraea]NBE96593.1 ATP-binding cassette domain-containing protein [Nonomuraea sp. K271]TLF68309.1 ABC transporter ATP-binding protein [Nonomuraea sp. KC401]
MTGSDRLPIAGARRTWAWLRLELRARWLGSTFAALVGVVGAAASVVPAYALGVLVDRVKENAPVSAIVPIAVVIVAAAVVGGVATGTATYLVGRVCGHMLADLRERTVARALRLPATTLERIGKGDLLSRVSSDAAAIGKAATSVIPTMISAFLLGVLSIAAMAGMDWRLGLAGAVAVPLYVAALRWYLPRAAPKYAAERHAVAGNSQLLVENMQGVRTVHAYRLEQRRLRDIGDASYQVHDISVSVFTLFTRFVGRINRAEFFGLAAILVVGFLVVRSGAATVGQSAAAAVLFHRLFNPIGMLLFTFDELQAAAASLARLVGVVDLAPDGGDDPDGDGVGEPAGAALELRDVRFRYDGGPEVLHGVSISVPAGARVALVGSTGAGKSTLAAIAAGILRPETGTVSVAGVAQAPDRLRAHVAIITQEVHVFAGPLIEDLRLARPGAPAGEIAAALSAVGALDWATALPAGLDTVVGEGGHELTTAQAQQLALARLILVDPAIAILDEATAEAGSLGARTLEESAAAATRGRTTLIVAHRLAQAAAADRVVVLEHGRIVEQGGHEELVAAGGRYAQLWRAWEARTPTSSSR